MGTSILKGRNNYFLLFAAAIFLFSCAGCSLFRIKIDQNDRDLLKNKKLLNERIAESGWPLNNRIFQDIEIADIKMSNTTLSNIAFINCNLTGFDLKNVTFKNCAFDVSAIKRSNFEDCKFTGCIWEKVEGRTERSDFSKCKFKGTAFDGIKTKDTAFKDCEFQNCMFKKSELVDTTFYGGIFESMEFKRCR
jgi:uncharacterized protein YjbI with pentapeptide repeats